MCRNRPLKAKFDLLEGKTVAAKNSRSRSASFTVPDSNRAGSNVVGSISNTNTNTTVTKESTFTLLYTSSQITNETFLVMVMRKAIKIHCPMLNIVKSF